MSNRIPVGLLAGLMLVAVTAAEAQRTRPAQPSPATEFKPLLDQYFLAWSTRRADVAASLYSTGPGTFFHGIGRSAASWSEYRAAATSFLDQFSAIELRAGGDLVAARTGNLAWTSVSFRGSGNLKEDEQTDFSGRHSAVWQRVGTAWRIVHEHVSLPATRPPTPPRKVEPTAEDRKAVTDLFQRYAAAWNGGQAADLAGLWKEDGDVSSLATGSVTSGSAAIRRLWDNVIARRSSSFATRLEVRVSGVRFAGVDTAIVDGAFEYWNAKQPAATAPAALERFVSVAARTDKVWRIDATRVAEVPRPTR